MKTPKHQELDEDYENIKSKHLEKLATKMLRKDSKYQKLKDLGKKYRKDKD
jgi:hypothetical protein